MDSSNKGVYTLNEFKSREVLKLAPDSFVTVMGKTEMRVLVSQQRVNNDGSLRREKQETINFKGGLTSINTSAAVQPGAGTCNLTFVCPTYDSLNENYYLTQPNGTKALFFQSMMEVRVFSKGRFLSNEGFPVYYPTFWGFITSVNESINGNEATISLSCRDMLGWWEYQVVNIVASPAQKRFGAASVKSAGTLYRFMNPWEVILNLFKETSFENFIFPSFSKNGIIQPSLQPYQMTSEEDSPGAYQLLAGGVISDWKNRYSMGDIAPSADSPYFSNLKMFGVNRELNLDTVSGDFAAVHADKMAEAIEQNAKNTPDLTEAKNNSLKNVSPYMDNNEASSQGKTTKVDPEKVAATSKVIASGDAVYMANHLQLPGKKLSLQFDLLGQSLPFASFGEYSVGAEPTRMTKLEMASHVSDAINYEFFQDTNGYFVFKPPFYNMDVTRNPVYVLRAEDILSIDTAEDSSQVVTYLEVSGPLIPMSKTNAYVAFHVDFALMEKYGIRERTAVLTFGNNPEVLKAMACSEMSRANANANTANVTIVHRPEMQLGYPVYIDHLDTFYYVKGISHSTTFGSTATTTLTLSARRTRVYDKYGKPLQGYIYKALDSSRAPDDSAKASNQSLRDASKAIYDGKDSNKALEKGAQAALEESSVSGNSVGTTYSSESSALEEYYKQNNLMSSPTPGFWEVVPSASFESLTSVSSDATKLDPGTSDLSLLHEVMHYTDSSNPYTDVNGFQHIGGFPYGANMVLKSDSTIQSAKSAYGDEGASDIAKLDLAKGGVSKTLSIPNTCLEKEETPISFTGDISALNITTSNP